MAKRDPKISTRHVGESGFKKSQNGLRTTLESDRSFLRSDGFVSALLFVLVMVTFYSTVYNGFVAFDDNEYVYENPHVKGGLSWEGLRWAFTTLDVGGLWHPLTWISLMLDCQLFGLRPGGHHLTGLLLHGINTVLLFLVLRRLTGTIWRCAMVAALFAFHPLHVETVAWIADRKDTLSAAFWMLSMLVYTRYARNAAAHPASSLGFLGYRFYWLAIILFTCGLMSKPTVMVLPAILLLLDWWPLQRVKSERGSRIMSIRLLFYEKIPFIALGIVCAIIGVFGQNKGGMLQTAEQFPISGRLANAVISYVHYLGQLFWPVGLSAYYPYPKIFSPAVLAVAGLIMSGLSLVALKLFHNRSYFAVGWFWYLIGLFPMIGLVQIGSYARADRYTYLPLIGMFLILVWGVCDFTKRWRFQAKILSALAVVVISCCIVLARQQLACWRTSETLFRHAVASSPDNYVAHNNLGNALVRSGGFAEARDHFRKALQIHPTFAAAHYNLANLLVREGNFSEALVHYANAVRSKPDHAESRYNYGIVLTRFGRTAEAMAQYREATRLKPDFVEAHHSLGGALVQSGQAAEGIVELLVAVRLQPDFAHARNDLGVALALGGNPAGAETNFAELVRLEPLNADGHYNLANALAAQGKNQAAIVEYAEALRLNPQDQRAYDKLKKLAPHSQ